MANVSLLRQIILLIYFVIYIATHIPLDIYMLKNRGIAKYPRPSFNSIIEGILVVVPTILFWIYLIVSPIVYFISSNSFLTLELSDETVQLTFLIIGSIFLMIGLLVGCLGRISRGFYLSRDEPELSTKLGHAIVRHPEYFMYITSFIGLPFLVSSPYLLVLLLGIVGYVITIKYEEEQLLETFGDEYKEYSQKVGKIVPRIVKRFDN